MENMHAVILGILQGLAEFLPVSSSGHLVLCQEYLGFKEPQLLLDLVLHLGILLAVCVYFYSDLKNMFQETILFFLDIYNGRAHFGDIHTRSQAELALMVLVGTVPTGIIGLTFRLYLERLFADPTMVGFALITTGFILLITQLLPGDEDRKDYVMILPALLVGTAQGIALIPGISRSGITIVCGMLCGLKWELAARFSFLLAIPAILGAVVLQLHSETPVSGEYLSLFAGFVTSFIVGIVALKILMGIVNRGRLYLFSPYCWLVGTLAICFG